VLLAPILRRCREQIAGKPGEYTFGIARPFSEARMFEESMPLSDGEKEYWSK